MSDPEPTAEPSRTEHVDLKKEIAKLKKDKKIFGDNERTLYTVYIVFSVLKSTADALAVLFDAVAVAYADDAEVVRGLSIGALIVTALATVFKVIEPTVERYVKKANGTVAAAEERTRAFYTLDMLSGLGDSKSLLDKESYITTRDEEIEKILYEFVNYSSDVSDSTSRKEVNLKEEIAKVNKSKKDFATNERTLYTVYIVFSVLNSVAVALALLFNTLVITYADDEEVARGLSIGALILTALATVFSVIEPTVETYVKKANANAAAAEETTKALYVLDDIKELKERGDMKDAPSHTKGVKNIIDEFVKYSSEPEVV